MLNRVEENATENNSLKIGQLLVEEGFIRKADLEQAMEIQQKELRKKDLPLGKLMVKKGLIDRRQLRELLQHAEIVSELEAFVVESGRIDPGELARYKTEKPSGLPLADFLVTIGHLTDDDLKAFFEEQLDSLKICELAVETGMVSEDALHGVLQSPRTSRTIGEILCEMNLITPLDLNAVLTKYRKHLQLGNVLHKHGLIDKPTLDWALKVHKNRGEPLGSILLKNGILTEAQLFSAFSLQYNIPFEKLEGFEYSSGQKEALTETVEKAVSDRFHILPLRLEENTLTVAVSDPADLEAVNSLRAKRVDLRTRCVLVTPATRKRLHAELYGPSSASPAPGGTSPEEASNAPPDGVSRGPNRSPVHQQSGSRRKPVSQRRQMDDVPAAVYQIVFSAPVIPKTDIQRLHHAYESLMEKTGRRRRKSDVAIFDTFIRSRYSDIRRRYGCSRIAFCVMRRREKVVLFATPEP